MADSLINDRTIDTVQMLGTTCDYSVEIKNPRVALDKTLFMGVGI